MLAMLHFAAVFASLLLSLALTPRILAGVFGNVGANARTVWYWAFAVAAFITLKFLI